MNTVIVAQHSDQQPKNDEERLFLHKLYDDPHWCKLLYAQRESMEKWYDWFDPTQPDAIQDRNRPWDYDHILPKSWVNRQGLPELVRTWLWSIGNFRAWPMEHNRSKSDNLMIENKLSDYHLDTKDDVIDASFIRSNNDEKSDIKIKWEELEGLCKELKFWDKEKGAPGWNIFIEVAMLRTVDVYCEWYEELRIGEITSPK